MFFVFPSSEAIANYLSQQIIELIRQKPDCVLGLATGSTMEPIYAELLRQVCEQEQLDLSRLTTFNLDEYLKLSPVHPQSYNHYMHQHLFDALGLQDSQINLPSGVCDNTQKECAAYSAALDAAGGPDFQLLGVGTNGHIGFNEPGTPFDSLTHVIELSANTRIDNGRFFANQDEVPTHAITMGIKDILSAKEIVLIATGAHKAETMQQLYLTPPDESMPATALKAHPNARIFMDPAAASKLPPEAVYQVD